MKKINRRTALATCSVVGVSMTLPSLTLANTSRAASSIKLGVIADLHGGLTVDAAARLDSFLKAMSTEQCDALVQLGDFAFPNEKHQAYADKFNQAHDETIHVIGNHEFDFGLKRSDCFKAWGIKAGYYRRDVRGLRVLVLDGNEKGSPTSRGGYPSYVGPQQQEWLKRELEASDKPILVLSHQPLAGPSAIDNAADVQRLLAKHASKVVACLNGHSHLDSLVQVSGVPYLHINSASYYWVGGETRMAYYADPLFTTITIDPATATLSVSPALSEWKGKSPKQIGYFESNQRPPESSVTPQIRPHHVSSSELKVMSWNIWGKLNQDSRYTVDLRTARDRTIEIIRQSGADMVAMIETYGSADEIADALGFHHHTRRTTPTYASLVAIRCLTSSC